MPCHISIIIEYMSKVFLIEPLEVEAIKVWVNN